ncbi:MAG TPA: PH domain-containing protein [Burkholderiales bacterium]|nr:PH domain-containing protein [Burkholderiales bacterium]
MAKDETVWSGSPSQVLNLPLYIVCGLTFWLVVPVFIAIWKWLVLRNTRYELTTERLKMREGVLNKELDELELYRAQDYKLEQPFWLRIFSLGTVTLRTADTSNPVIVLRGLRESEHVYELLRTHVEECRVKKRVLPLDLQQA